MTDAEMDEEVVASLGDTSKPPTFREPIREEKANFYAVHCDGLAECSDAVLEGIATSCLMEVAERQYGEDAVAAAYSAATEEGLHQDLDGAENSFLGRFLTHLPYALAHQHAAEDAGTTAMTDRYYSTDLDDDTGAKLPGFHRRAA